MTPCFETPETDVCRPCSLAGTSSGFGTPRLLTTGHDVASPVVRYFFKEDAEGVALLVRALRSRDGSWRAEDCRSYRHKPPAGTVEVWPHT